MIKSRICVQIKILLTVNSHIIVIKIGIYPNYKNQSNLNIKKVVRLNVDIWQVDYQNNILQIPFGFVKSVKILFSSLKVIAGTNTICKIKIYLYTYVQ